MRAGPVLPVKDSSGRTHDDRVHGGSLLILVAVGSAYGAYRLAPQTIVQPLFLVGEMVGPALIGLYVFGERDTLARHDQLYFALGLAGGLLVALSFSFQ